MADQCINEWRMCGPQRLIDFLRPARLALCAKMLESPKLLGVCECAHITCACCQLVAGRGGGAQIACVERDAQLHERIRRAASEQLDES